MSANNKSKNEKLMKKRKSTDIVKDKKAIWVII